MSASKRSEYRRDWEYRRDSLSSRKWMTSWQDLTTSIQMWKTMGSTCCKLYSQYDHETEHTLDLTKP